MKKLLALLLALMMVLSLAACAKDEAPADDAADDAADAPADDAADAPADDAADDAAPAVDVSTWAEWEQALAENLVVSGEDEYTIGITITSFTDKFQMRVLGEVKDYAAVAYPNVKILEGDGEFDANIQIGIVENWCAQQIDSAIVVPVDSNASASICDILHEAGIPLTCPNTDLNCDDRENCDHVFAGSDHYYSGQLQAEYLIANVDDTETQKICYLEGSNGYDHTTLRKAGFFETLDAAGFNYELLSSLEGEYLRDKGLQIAEDWFTQYGEEIDIIGSANDEMAWGAYEAMKGAGLSGVYCLGIDANDDTKQAVADGTELCFTVFQNAEAQGKWGMIAAYSAAAGKPSASNKIDIPYEPVDINNVADYM